MTSITPVRAELPLSSSNLSGFFGRGSSAVVRVLQAVASCFLWARDYAVGVSYTLKAVWFNDNFHREVCLIPIAQRREVIAYVRELLGVDDLRAYGSSVIRAVAQIPSAERREIVRFAQRLQNVADRFNPRDCCSVIHTIRRIVRGEREDVIAMATQIGCPGFRRAWDDFRWGPRMIGMGLKLIVETLGNFSPAFREDFRRRQFPGLFPPHSGGVDNSEIIAIKKIHDLHCEELQGEVIKSALELVDFREGGVGANGFQGRHEITSVIHSLAEKPVEAESIAHGARELFDQDSTYRRDRPGIVRYLVSCAKEEREEIVTYAKQTITRARVWVGDIERGFILNEIMAIPQKAREEVMSKVFEIIDSEFTNNRLERFEERLPMIIQEARLRAGHYLSWESKVSS